MGAEYSVSMVNVASPRGIDGAATIGRLPDLHQLCRAITVWVALSVGDVMQAQEQSPPSPYKPSQVPANAPSDPTETPRAELRAWMKDMNHETEFGIRQAAWHKAHDAMWKAFDEETDDPDAILAALKVDARGKPLELSPEQQGRHQVLKTELATWRRGPTALPPRGRIRGDMAIRLIGNKLRLNVTVADETMPELMANTLRLEGERAERLVNNILSRSANASHSKPALQNDGGVRLMPAEAKESVAWSPDLLGVVTTDEFGLPSNVELQMEPGRGQILAFINEVGTYSSMTPVKNGDGTQHHVRDPSTKDEDIWSITLTLPQSGRPPITHPFGNNIYRQSQALQPKHVNAVVADLPISMELGINKGARKMGEQTLGLQNPTQLPDGQWQVECVSHLFPHVDWATSPVEWDALTFYFGDSNRYALRDRNGSLMPTNITCTDFECRSMKVTLRCPHEPVSGMVTVYSRMSEQELELPRLQPVTPPAPLPAQ